MTVVVDIHIRMHTTAGNINADSINQQSRIDGFMKTIDEDFQSQIDNRDRGGLKIRWNGGRKDEMKWEVEKMRWNGGRKDEMEVSVERNC